MSAQGIAFASEKSLLLYVKTTQTLFASIQIWSRPTLLSKFLYNKDKTYFEATD